MYNNAFILFRDYEAWTSFLYIHFIETIKREWGIRWKNQHSIGSILTICSSSMGAYSRGGAIQEFMVMKQTCTRRREPLYFIF